MCVQVVKDPMWSIPIVAKPSPLLQFDVSVTSECLKSLQVLPLGIALAISDLTYELT